RHRQEREQKRCQGRRGRKGRPQGHRASEPGECVATHSSGTLVATPAGARAACAARVRLGNMTLLQCRDGALGWRTSQVTSPQPRSALPWHGRAAIGQVVSAGVRVAVEVSRSTAPYTAPYNGEICHLLNYDRSHASRTSEPASI